MHVAFFCIENILNLFMRFCHCVLVLFVYLFGDCGVGMSDKFENCVWDVCLTFDVLSRKITSRPWHVVKLCPDPGMS